MKTKIAIDQLVRVVSAREFPVLKSWDDGFPEVVRHARFDKRSTFVVQAAIKGLPKAWIIGMHKGSGEFVAFPADAVEPHPSHDGLLRRFPE